MSTSFSIGQNVSPFTPQMGLYNYNDAGTSAVPIPISTVGFTQLTNDTLGPQTLLTYALPSPASIWNPASNQFDFSGLSVGDQLQIRLDMQVNVTALSRIQLRMQFGIGATPFTLSFRNQEYLAGAAQQISITQLVYIGGTLAQMNPAEVQMMSNAAGVTCTVFGWAVQVMRLTGFP